ncbi:MAG: hypothetical protein QGG36_13985 [Pirellulaceae bacterium]|jgi:hypothetical protein|nr:hypothetical protein [Pirellulaceae bacterium]MDP7016909.1 hypothetical protein [Pirellulaceae bacterium]
MRYTLLGAFAVAAVGQVALAVFTQVHTPWGLVAGMVFLMFIPIALWFCGEVFSRRPQRIYGKRRFDNVESPFSGKTTNRDTTDA